MSPTTQQAASSAPPPSAAPSVNRKKQKRRQKQAAKLAAEQEQQPVATAPKTLAAPASKVPASNGHNHSLATPKLRAHSSNEAVDGSQDADEYYDTRGEDLFYSDEDSQPTTAAVPPLLTGARPKKKKRSKPRSDSQHEEDQYYQPRMPGAFHPPPPPPPPPPFHVQAPVTSRKMSKDRIWNTSTQEERERIKEFWLSLEESQRKSLVKVEKEAVLKKMKEQQRNSCSCTVCGRKRTAIEEELEVLYDAYYDELEQYAAPTSRCRPPFGHPLALLAYSPSASLAEPPLIFGSKPKGRLMEDIEDDEDEEEEDEEEEVYSDEEDDYDDESYDDEPRVQAAADFLQFGNSLQVNGRLSRPFNYASADVIGGILTVADDLLKNDGKKFIEMMEQLAERRMAREKGHAAPFDPSPLRPPLHNHDHPPLDDEDDYEDEDMDYDDSQDDEYDDDMEAMSEEQRMEEGRRMFQIFAARMFEQRVLTAYKEKVAKERQEKLLEELADESRLDAQREAKRAKEAQKKKDRKKQQKAAKEEERQRKESEKAAEEAAIKAAEEKRLDEQRQKKEEQRKKKEAEKKALEEDRLRKEAERNRKAQEVKAQQVEAERKQREQREQEKKRKDDARRKEREDREIKEKDLRERKEKEAAEKRERETKGKAERESKEKAKKEENSKATQPIPVPVPPLLRKPSAAVPSVPPGLQLSTSSGASPHLPVATPALPKTTTPSKPRQASTHGSHQSSPKTSQQQSGSSATSPGSSQPSFLANAAPLSAKLPPATSQVPLGAGMPPIGPPPGMHPPPPGMAPLPGMPAPPGYQSGFGPGVPGMMPRGSPHDAPGFPPQGFGGPPRGYPQPAGLGFPPGINGMRVMSQGRGSPVDAPPPHPPMANTNTSGWMPTHASNHSRQTSASYDKPSFDAPGMAPGAISRPAPIQRPSSIPHQYGQQDVDDLSKQLGSSALLDDLDDGPAVHSIDVRGMAPGPPRPGRIGFEGMQSFPQPIGSAKLDAFSPRHMQGPTWGMPMNPLTNAPSNPTWSNTPNSNWHHPPVGGFGAIGGPSRTQSRPVVLRLLAAQSCRLLASGSPHKTKQGLHSAGEFHHIDDLVRQMDALRSVGDGPIKHQDVLNILDTEGDAHNGGGNFIVQNLPQGTFVKLEADGASYGMRMGNGAPGDIGSPIATPAVMRGVGAQAPPSF